MLQTLAVDGDLLAETSSLVKEAVKSQESKEIEEQKKVCDFKKKIAESYLEIKPVVFHCPFCVTAVFFLE